jgi:sulfur-oxidizing protein SoxY
VPLTLRSRIPRTDRIVLFVEKNPFPLIAAFDFSAEVIPAVSLNIKMDQSSAVIVLARAAGTLYRAERWVRVVRGGCGDISG